MEVPCTGACAFSTPIVNRQILAPGAATAGHATRVRPITPQSTIPHPVGSFGNTAATYGSQAGPGLSFNEILCPELQCVCPVSPHSASVAPTDPRAQVCPCVDLFDMTLAPKSEDLNREHRLICRYMNEYYTHLERLERSQIHQLVQTYHAKKQARNARISRMQNKSLSGRSYGTPSLTF